MDGFLPSHHFVLLFTRVNSDTINHSPFPTRIKLFVSFSYSPKIYFYSLLLSLILAQNYSLMSLTRPIFKIIV